MTRTFLNFSADKLRQLEGRIQVCLDRLAPEQVWARNADSQNAVGNLVLHLCGNVGQWILSGVGGQPDTRVRDREFEARGGVAIDELKQRLQSTVESAATLIQSLPDERLTQRVNIQGYDVTVLEAIYHVVEHFAMHAGQIFFATKLHTEQDLGFYRHLKQARHADNTP